jgi:hypothetical protein
MGPTEAKFDGAKGVRVTQNGETFRFLLKRGKQKPSEYPEVDFKEQLIWLYPDDEPSRLLWCSEDDEWFELTFNPIEKP